MEFGFGDSSNTLRAGVLDLNAEFDTPVTQGIFTASPFGIGTEFSQTGARGPVCWPTTGLGIRVAGERQRAPALALRRLRRRPGTDDDDFTSTRVSGDEGALLVGELEYSSDRIHKAALGAWIVHRGLRAASMPLSPVMPVSRTATPASTRTSMPDMGSFGRVDLRRRAARRLRRRALQRRRPYVCSAAFTASHLFASRPGDSLGLGVAWAHLGDEYRALRSFDGQPATAAETTFELVYRAELTPWLSLLPNVQFVSSPGADPVVGDSWLAGLRFEISRDRTWQLQARGDGRVMIPTRAPK